tara:strand:- start:20 stop:475 length:456 start_codon:yes stop_codon:yes gene_type:complete
MKIDKPLTEMQKKFCELYVQNAGRWSNTEIAIRAGYKPESAYQRAHELLNPKICPHVVRYTSLIKEDFLKKNDIDPNKHLSRLNHLALEAEKEKMFGVALRAEELRGKVAGYYVDKQLNVNKSMEETTEELEKKMKNILDEYAPMIEGEKK